MTSPSTDRRYGVNPGLGIKAPVRVATIANITLNGEQTIDGISVVSGDRVLVKDQTDDTENGVYVCDSGDWSRDIDSNGNRDFVTGTIVTVNTGTTNANTLWRVTTAAPIVIGTSSLTFTPNTTSATDSSAISFTAAGVGTSVRTAQAKMRETISVVDFGASTASADNSAAFTAAFTACGTEGELYVPEGTFILGTGTAGAGLLIQGAIKIRGAGIGVTVLQVKDGADTLSSMISTNGVTTGISFSDITFDGNASNQTFTGDNGQTGVIVRNSQNVFFYNCEFKDWGMDGIQIYSDSPSTAPCVYISVKGCVFDNIRRGGVTMINGKRITIANNIFRNGSGMASPVTNCGVTWEPSGALDSLSGLTVTGNQFYDMLAGCRIANVGNLSSASNVIISNNNFQYITGEAAIVLYYLASGGGTVIGNRFNACGNATAGSANIYALAGGIFMQETDAFIIESNWFQICTDYSVTDPTYGGTIYGSGGGTFSQIKNNTFYYSAGHGIHLLESTSGLATNRQITGNILLTGGQTAGATYKAIWLNGTVGSQGSHDLVTGNTIATADPGVGFEYGVYINYDDGTSKVGLNNIFGTGVSYTFTGAGTPTYPVLLDYTYTSTATACTGALTNSVSWTLVQTGKVVTLQTPTIAGTPSDVAAIIMGVPIPAQFRPTTNIYGHTAVSINNAQVAQPGPIQVTTAGEISFRRDSTGTTWGTAANSGVSAGFVSWILA